MLIVKRSEQLGKLLSAHHSRFKSVGLVPTMGALHSGHLSLLNRCKNECDVTVASIFVNPTQFNNKEDFEKYPVTLEDDIYTLERNGCDVLYLPELKDMYPDERYKSGHFNLGLLGILFEGKYRPGIFQGVCQAVKRLLQIINPSIIYAGQKDYQQCLVIKKLLKIMQSKTYMVICETVREPDGLAMSSRNIRLTKDDRKKAPALYHALHIINSGGEQGNPEDTKCRAISILQSAEFKIDYVEIADAQTLEPIKEWNKGDKTVALIAASINNIRLIDNIIING